MSVASETRAAVRAEPFLYDALRAGVVNYTAAARYLDVGDEEAVAAALRRYADDLPSPAGSGDGDGTGDRDGAVRVTMRSGVGPADDPSGALLVVGDTVLAVDGGDLTGVQATGAAGPVALGRVLRRLEVEDVEVEAAGACEGTLLVVVGRRAGADAVRLVEDAC